MMTENHFTFIPDWIASILFNNIEDQELAWVTTTEYVEMTTSMGDFELQVHENKYFVRNGELHVVFALICSYLKKREEMVKTLTTQRDALIIELADVQSKPLVDEWERCQENIQEALKDV